MNARGPYRFFKRIFFSVNCGDIYGFKISELFGDFYYESYDFERNLRKLIVLKILGFVG